MPQTLFWPIAEHNQGVNSPNKPPTRSNFEVKECALESLSLNTPLPLTFLCNPHHTHTPSIKPCSAQSSHELLPAPLPSEHSTPMPPSGIRWLVRHHPSSETGSIFIFALERNVKRHFFFLPTFLGAEVSGKRFWEKAGIKEVGGKA